MTQFCNRELKQAGRQTGRQAGKHNDKLALVIIASAHNPPLKAVTKATN